MRRERTLRIFKKKLEQTFVSYGTFYTIAWTRDMKMCKPAKGGIAAAALPGAADLVESPFDNQSKEPMEHAAGIHELTKVDQAVKGLEHEETHEEKSDHHSPKSHHSSLTTISHEGKLSEAEEKHVDSLAGDEEDDDRMKDHEDMDLENLVAQDWKGALGEAPMLRRQKRRQRQRANAKVGRALRRFVQRKGHRNAPFQEFLLDQAQRAIVGYLDFLFGPMNLPEDQYLNSVILDPLYKSAMVASIMHFEGVQRALAPLGPVEPELQLAIVIDSLRWSQSVRCGPVCYPDGKIVYFMRLKPQQPMQMVHQQSGVAPIVAAPAIWLFMCGNCTQVIDARMGYCSTCGMAFE